MILTYHTLRPILWFKWIGGDDFHCEISAGETCEYFGHSDTYIFASRGGVAPWFSRKTIEANPNWFKPDFPTGPIPGDQFTWHTGERVTVVSVDGAMTNLRFNRNDGPVIAVPTGLLTEYKRIKAINQTPGKGN